MMRRTLSSACCQARRSHIKGTETDIHRLKRDLFYYVLYLVYIAKFFSFSSKTVNRVRLTMKTNCIEKNKIKVDYMYNRREYQENIIFFLIATNKIMNYFLPNFVCMCEHTHIHTYLHSFDLAIVQFADRKYYLNSLSFCIRQRIEHSSIEHQ